MTELAVNWRRGFKRIALAYLAGSILALVMAVVWDVSQINCPSEYHYTGEEMRRAAVFKQLQAKRDALRGKCDILSPEAAARRRMALEARERLGIPDEAFARLVQDLPPCPVDALKIDPIPYSDTIPMTVVVPADELRRCWADVWNWKRTLWVAAFFVGFPIALGLLGGSGFGLFRLGRWLYRGFKAD